MSSSNISPMQLAIQHHQAGRLAEAEKICRQILAQSPDDPEALNLLGVLAAQAGRLDLAIQLITRSAQIQPNNVQAHSNLGTLLKDAGQLDQAIAACRRALELDPNYPQALNNLSDALCQKGQLDESIAAAQRAIQLSPQYAQAHVNLGNALRNKDQPEQAIAKYRQAIAINPSHAEAYSNLAAVLSELGRFDEAIAANTRAIQLNPGFAEAHWNLACLSLLLGDYKKGWAEYEWRWGVRALQLARSLKPFPQPRWEGADLKGRTILLHVEQGLGDTIQFIRYAPMVAARGGRVILESPPPLSRLLKSIPGIHAIIDSGQPLPPFDVHCPLLTLPLVFQTTLDSIPSKTPYFLPDPALVENWRSRLATNTKKRVGLVWAGGPAHKGDRHRSMALRQFQTLGSVENVQFISLQKGKPADQIKDVPELGLIDFAPALTDFAETAALIAQLDLVITVDTAVAHLAGALNKPTWILLPHIPDWRWLLNRDDSPWYPSVRLFRQNQPGDWDQVMQRVADALKQFAQIPLD